MLKNRFSLILFCISILFFTNKPVFSEIIKEISVEGNERISSETVIMFSKVSIDEDLKSEELNNIIKNIYQSNFFNDVSVTLKNNKLIIYVDEFPIIENINFNGIKSQTLLEKVTKDLNLISRSSYNESLLKKDRDKILKELKNLGYYFSEIEVTKKDLENKKINLVYEIKLGDKAKINKISFIGDKKFKDRKLRSIIISEEYKFWKFISGKKYLNENIILFDERLLKNFYRNKGYYAVKINSSFAKMYNNDEFELVYNIDAKDKYFFNDLDIKLPLDFDSANYNELKIFLENLKGEPYSINTVSEILDKIDLISINEQYESVKATVTENILLNKINLSFNIEETERFIVEKINILGNSITRENVIRNQLIIDEGDPYNDILAKKSINEIKSLNFFSEVNTEVVDGKNLNTKIINITVEEKPTGEITAGAGFGTSGEVIEFSVKENNYLGKGLGIDTAISLSSESIVGKFNVNNPNYNNSDKSINFGLQALETDKLKNFGYKSKKIGGLIGTNFEYLEDFNLGLSTSLFVENIETDSNASARQKKQKGDYFDTYLDLKFDYDKRNQKYKTSDGYRSFYSIGLPIISENNTLNNFYNYKIFSELYEENISTLSLSLSSSHSLTGDDIKLSERLYIPTRKLRGFERGKVGPKDGNDFIGGNYYAILNITSTLPQVFPNAQNVDFLTFIDVANLWGVDDETLDNGSELRSSIGLGIEWFTPVGPLSFSLAAPISKSSTDKTETFRFNLGTTF